jgi:hypothetical protein
MASVVDSYDPRSLQPAEMTRSDIGTVVALEGAEATAPATTSNWSRPMSLSLATEFVTSQILHSATAELPEADTVLTTTLNVDAPTAYARFCEIERLPSWLSIVHAAKILTRNDDGRPERVSFLAHMERATIGYTLTYTYAESQLRVGWTTDDDSGIGLSGSASFHALGDRGSLMNYELMLDMPNLAAWEDPFFDSHAASAVVCDFRDYVKRAGKLHVV